MWRRLILLCALAPPAAAETPIAEILCAPRDEIVVRLQGATVTGSGLRDSETVLEVWARPSGHWVLVQSYANGTACILAMGEAWDVATPPPA
jgi:hypothetical protein